MAGDLSALNGATIAFDLDGCLVDTAPDIGGSMNMLLAEEGLPLLSRDQVTPLIGRGIRSALERAFDGFGAPLSDERATELAGRFRTAYLARIADESRPFPGCLEALDALAGAGAILTVCTNKQTNLSVALLEALGMAGRFAAIVGADQPPACKPDGRHVIHAVEMAGGDLARAVMIGDSENDVWAARSAGVPSVFCTFGYCEHTVEALKPDAVIDAYADLPAALAALLRP